MIKPMLCTDDVKRFTSVLDDEEGVYCSPKLDGVRCIATIYPGEDEVHYLSRNGKEFKNFNKFDEDVLDLRRGLVVSMITTFNINTDTFYLDGEVIANVPKGEAQDFSKVMTQVHRLKDVDSSIFSYQLFDLPCIPNLSFGTRYALLTRLLRESELESAEFQHVEHIYTVDRGFFQEIMEGYIAQGYEGVVFKSSPGLYECGKKSKHWLKMKPTYTEDLYVVDVIQGTGKYSETLGALICDFNGTRVRVGSGFTDEERDEFWKNPPRMIEVKYQEKTKAGSLRFPIFVRVREDKD
jgi:DNA ligase-1